MTTPLAPAPKPAPFQIRLTDIFVLLAVIGIHLTIWGNPSELGLIITIIVSWSLVWLLVLYLAHRRMANIRYRNLRFIITLILFCLPLNRAFTLLHAVHVKQLAAFHMYQQKRVMDLTGRTNCRIRLGSSTDSDDVTEYLSTFGPTEHASLLKENLANAECNDPLHDAAKCTPDNGYLLKFLKGQGPGAEGGAKSYYKNGKKTEGYAFVFYPAHRSDAWRFSYQWNSEGQLVEKDLGEGTFEEISKMEVFDPTGWTKVDWP